MMEIQYLGHACFKIIGKKISVITDPFDAKTTGYKPIKQSTDVVTVSHDHYDHSYTKSIPGGPLLFDTPGEYEAKGAEFQGISAFHDDTEGKERGNITMFVMEIDGIRLCHLGDLGVELSSEQVEQLGDVDILLIPVGGIFTINAKTAAKIASEIEARIVIPMHYGTKDGKIKLDGVDKFLHEMGAKPEAKNVLKISRKDLPEEPEVVVLKY